MILLLYMLAYINNDDSDLAGLLEESNCWTCMSDKQKLEAAIGSMANAYLLSAQDIANAVKCMPCAQPGQIKAAIAYSICKYFNQLPQ